MTFSHKHKPCNYEICESIVFMVAQQHWLELWHQKITREHYLYLQPHRHENANTSESWTKYGNWKLKGTVYHSQWYSITPPELRFMRGCTALSHNSKSNHDTRSGINTWYYFCTIPSLLFILKQTPENLRCFHSPNFVKDKLKNQWEKLPTAIARPKYCITFLPTFSSNIPKTGNAILF